MSAVGGGALVIIRYAADLSDAISWGVGGLGAILFVVGILVLLHRRGILFALPKKRSKANHSPHDVASLDQVTIYERIHATAICYLEPQRGDREKRLRFDIYFVNASVFDLRIKRVDGKVYYEGQPCGPTLGSVRKLNANRGRGR